MSRRSPLCHLFSALAVVALFGGCTDMPEPADRTAEGAYPTLLPLDEFLAVTRLPGRAEDNIEVLRQRVLGLRSRASRLSGPVIEAPTRQRMLAMIARGPV